MGNPFPAFVQGYDHLDNVAQYFDLNPHFETACAFLRRDDLAQLEPGNYDIDGDNAWAIIAKSVPKTRRDLIRSLHYILENPERLGLVERYKDWPYSSAHPPRSQTVTPW